MILTKLDIPKRQQQCSGGRHPFQPGDKSYTLVSLEAEGWRRQDLCETCWNELKSRGLPAQTKSYWHSRIPLKQPEEALPKHKEERALVLLKRALLENSPTTQREAFILALYLARKKYLQFRQELEQLGDTIYLYEVAATEELLPIKKMVLHSNDIDILQQRLAQMLA